MAREIKFRAFEDGIVYYSDSWDSAKLLGAKLGDSCISVFFNRFFGHHTLSQFTGLKDKNGKEIYEGDVMKRITVFDDGGCDVHLGIITWEDCSYYSHSIKQEISRSLGGKSDNTTYEVIGNIYENTELL